MNFSELMLAINSHFDENLSRQEVMSILKRSEKYNSCIQEKFSSTTIYGDSRKKTLISTYHLLLSMATAGI